MQLVCTKYLCYDNRDSSYNHDIMCIYVCSRIVIPQNTTIAHPTKK